MSDIDNSKPTPAVQLRAASIAQLRSHSLPRIQRMFVHCVPETPYLTALIIFHLYGKPTKALQLHV